MNEFLEYKDLYIQTSKEYVQSLNSALLKLEKNPADKEAIEEIFRSAHSLKSQSAAMEYESTGFLCHTVEDVFYEIKNGRLTLTSELSDHLFAAFDALSGSISRIEKDNQEADLAEQAETLKTLSGVKTEGVGKSQHTDGSEATTPASSPPEATAPVPTVPVTAPSAPQLAAAATSTSAAAPPLAETTMPVTPAATITTIAVKVEVLDEMMNLLENLLIERLKLKHVASTLQKDYAGIKDYLYTSEKVLASLQYQIMKARAVPVSIVFDHFPRAVRDLARAENKQIELVMTGNDLELDRTIVDRLDEPLIHLIRNAVSHGITDKGTITLTAERQKDYAQISVADDGEGINWQQVAKKAGLPETETNPKALKDALFSGISTSETVTQISGRGVGLMAIKKMVDNFGGAIDVISKPGAGTTFIIKLPLTLAIAKALIFTVGSRTFAIPTLAVEHIASVPANAIKKIADQETFVLDETDIPLIRLSNALAAAEQADVQSLQPATPVRSKTPDSMAIIINENGSKVGLVVDTVLDTSDIVIKPVPDVLKNIRGFAGVTILSDGKTALVINPQEIV